MCIPKSGFNIERARCLKVLEYDILTGGAKPATKPSDRLGEDRTSQPQFIDSLEKVVKDFGKRRLLLGKAL